MNVAAAQEQVVDLYEYVRRQKQPLPVEEAVLLWRSAASALRSLTDAGTFHWRLRIRSFAIDSDRSPESLRIIDRANIVEIARGEEPVETPPWPLAAPEQTGLVAGRPGPASNIYSLGVLGFFLLTGDLPFGRVAGPHFAERIVREGLPQIHREDLNVPTGGLLNRIVRRATEKRPEDRYVSVAQLQAELALLVPIRRDARGALRPPLVGRTSALRVIAGITEETRRGGPSGRLFVTGEPGIGKTFLWRAAEAMLKEPDEWWIYTKIPQTGGVPYAGLAALLEALLAEVSHREGSSLYRLLADHGVSDRGIRVGAAIVPRLAVALGIDPGQAMKRAAPPVEPSTAELATILFALTKHDAMTVVAIDDVQWLDEQTLAVLHQLLRDPHPCLFLAMLGRRGTHALVPADVAIRELPLDGLRESECRELLRLLSPATHSHGELTAFDRRVLARARGNPLATVNLLELLRRESAMSPDGAGGLVSSWYLREASPDLPEMRMLEALARERMKEVGPACRRLVLSLSLLLPPVSLDLIDRIPSSTGGDASALLAEAEAALLLNVDRGREEVRFFHDSVESTARHEAIEDRSLVTSTSRLLFDASRHGDHRASFALARLLSSEILGPQRSGSLPERLPETGRSGQITTEGAFEILSSAAAQALEVAAADDALRFSRAALTLCHASGRTDRDGHCLAIHRIAHRAAYQLDDAFEMSRHFDQIRRYGSAPEANEARQLWIARAYSKAMFPGAIRIGLQVLRGLEAIHPAADLHLLSETARRYLRTTNPRRVFRRLMRAPHAENPRTALIFNTFPRLILPALEVDRPLLPLLAYLIIRESLVEGVADYTGLAFVIWAIVECIDGTVGNRLYSLSEFAQQLASRSVDPIARHSIHTFSVVFTATVRMPFSAAMIEALELCREGERLGNHEFAMDALHIHAQGLLSCGTPLDEVLRILGSYRERMSSRRFDRDARALAKFQQAAETLTGRTGDQLRLSGSICEEDDEWRAIGISGDSMSVVGFYYLKAMLATYADRPDLALQYCRLAGDSDSPLAGLHEDSLVHFYRGMAAFRSGAAREGARMLERFRRWSRSIPETHEHRYLALRAEQAAARADNPRAVRLLATARRLALSRGYPHEAALFAERQGDVLQLDPGGTDQAVEPLHLAQSLYVRWGAIPAADRVRTKLSWVERPYVFSPILSDEQFLTRITSAETSNEMLHVGLEELSRFSAAESAYLMLVPLAVSSEATHRVVLTQALRDNRTNAVTEIEGNELPNQVATILADLQSGETRLETIEFLGNERPVLALRCDPSTSVSVRVCLIARVGSPPFSSFVASRARGALMLAATIVQLRESVETVAAQAEDLKRAREELVTAHEYGRVLFATLPDAFYLVDRNGTLLFRNRAADNYGDHRKGSADQAGLRSSEVSVPQIVHEAIARMSLDGGRSVFEFQWKDRFLRILVARPEEVASSSIEGVYAVSVSDVTEQKKQEEAFRRQEQQLIVSDRLASIGMLASTIAHEVSNPNYILQLNAQALTMLLNQWRSRQTPVAEQSIVEAERMVSLITEGTRRIEEVVQQVKQYGREGRAEEWELVQPELICERALRFCRIMAEQYTRHLSFECVNSVPPVRAIRGRLEQALINLIKNACESLPDPSGRVTVRVTCDHTASEVRISVFDTGSGLPPEPPDRFGQPFVSTRNGGTGLGLSIVQTILEHHGGRFQISPSPDQFSTVATMVLPRGDLSRPD